MLYEVITPSRRGAGWWWTEPMTIAAINEQLLRAIGVGVALLDLENFRLRFSNDTFREWFGEIEVGKPLTEMFPALDFGEVRKRNNFV